MKIWQKNYNVNEIIEQFTIGKDRDLDLDLAWFDIVGSMAHIRMLSVIGLLDEVEQKRLHAGLKEILDEVYKLSVRPLAGETVGAADSR